MWGKRRDREGVGMLLGGRAWPGSFVLRVFISLLQVGILGEVSGEDFSRTFISSPGVPSQGCGFQ